MFNLTSKKYSGHTQTYLLRKEVRVSHAQHGRGHVFAANGRVALVRFDNDAADYETRPYMTIWSWEFEFPYREVMIKDLIIGHCPMEVTHEFQSG